MSITYDGATKIWSAVGSSTSSGTGYYLYCAGADSYFTVKSATVFNSGPTSYISTTLSNDNVLIAYRDADNSYYGTFIILDQNGNIVKDKITFNSGDTSHISTTTLSNGNVLIAYQDSDNSSYGTFVIYDGNDPLSIDGVTVNKLNNIPVENILQPSTKYELVYDGEKFVDEDFKKEASKVLYDITLTKAVTQINLPGIIDKLENGKLYACIVIGSSSASNSVHLGNVNIGYVQTSERMSLGLFAPYNDGETVKIYTFYGSSNSGGLSGVYGLLKSSSTKYEYIIEFRNLYI